MNEQEREQYLDRFRSVMKRSFTEWFSVLEDPSSFTELLKMNNTLFLSDWEIVPTYHRRQEVKEYFIGDFLTPFDQLLIDMKDKERRIEHAVFFVTGGSGSGKSSLIVATAKMHGFVTERSSERVLMECNLAGDGITTERNFLDFLEPAKIIADQGRYCLFFVDEIQEAWDHSAFASLIYPACDESRKGKKLILVLATSYAGGDAAAWLTKLRQLGGKCGDLRTRLEHLPVHVPSSNLEDNLAALLSQSFRACTADVLVIEKTALAYVLIYRPFHSMRAHNLFAQKIRSLSQQGVNPLTLADVRPPTATPEGDFFNAFIESNSYLVLKDQGTIKIHRERR